MAEGERCDLCGESYELVWYAPNELWNQINGGPNGMACPRCFDLACQRVGFHPVWRAHRAGEIEGLETERDKALAALEQVAGELEKRAENRSGLAREGDHADYVIQGEANAFDAASRLLRSRMSALKGDG